MKFGIFVSLILLFLSCGKKETADQKEILDAGLYGGTWQVSESSGYVYTLEFTGNSAKYGEFYPGVGTTYYNYTLTASGSSAFIANNSGTISNWSYTVNGNNLHLCMSSTCYDFTR